MTASDDAAEPAQPQTSLADEPHSPVNGEDERRTTRRHALRLNKIFSAEIVRNGDTLPCYLYIIDISEGGIRITSDYSFPKDGAVRVKFYFDDPVAVSVKVIWQKLLEGGTNVYGLKFIDMSDGEADTIRGFMHKYSPEFRRQNFRLKRVVYMEFLDSAVQGRQYTFVLDLNTGGMRIVSEMAFEVGLTLSTRLYLDLDLPPVDVTAVVTAVREATLERHQMDFEFKNLDAEATDRINAYLDRAASGELDQQTVRPQLELDVREDQPPLKKEGT